MSWGALALSIFFCMLLHLDLFAAKTVLEQCFFKPWFMKGICRTFVVFVLKHSGILFWFPLWCLVILSFLNAFLCCIIVWKKSNLVAVHIMIVFWLLGTAELSPIPNGDFAIGQEQLALLTRDQNISTMEQYGGASLPPNYFYWYDFCSIFWFMLHYLSCCAFTLG